MTHGPIKYNFFLKRKNLFDSWVKKKKDSLQVRIDMGVMAVKEEYRFPRAPELEPHQTQVSIIPRTPLFMYPYAEDTR